MLIKRISNLTGKLHERDVPCTEEQLREWRSGTDIQVAMSNLSDDDREFVLSGITPEEWDRFINEDGCPND